ncbi:MAG: outer membrane protein assembly factor [Rubripirellula sp.]
MTHTRTGRMFGWLAITGSLVCLGGCAQLTGQSAGAFGTPSTGVFPTAQNASAPANAAAPTSVQTSVAPGAVPSFAQNPAPVGAVAQTSGTQPYTARQFPSGGGGAPSTYNLTPPAGSPLPPGSDFTQSPPLSTGVADPYAPPAPPIVNFQPGPRVRQADLVINGFPARTGRIMLGGAVNSDAGVTGQLTVDERNFDISRWPTSFQDLFSGTAFRGAGQTFRIEAAPGTDFKRYTAQFADPNLFGYKPISMSVSGFLYDRRFNDWDEERMGGRLSFGYRITPDLSVSAGISGQNVDITNPRSTGAPQLNAALGDNALYSGEISLKHDTRDSPIQASRGHYFEFTFREVFGDFDYAKFDLEYRRYWLLSERADTSGRQTLSYSTRLGFSGDETPIFENYFAGGYATLRGFDFRGASPVVNGVEVGGRFQWLNTVEYMFPITADDAFRGVAFVDFGTVEEDIEINEDNYRVAPGLGVRVAIPMLGPAPLAFDFAYPVTMADTDEKRVFSFYMSLIR